MSRLWNTEGQVVSFHTKSSLELLIIKKTTTTPNVDHEGRVYSNKQQINEDFVFSWPTSIAISNALVSHFVRARCDNSLVISSTSPFLKILLSLHSKSSDKTLGISNFVQPRLCVGEKFSVTFVQLIIRSWLASLRTQTLPSVFQKKMK